ncbi:MAG: 5-formyltetrahydrofolate cyclo-ligase [Acidobacteriota bacterium]
MSADGETKDELRRRLTARLASVTADERVRAGATARARLLEVDAIRRARSLLVCLSFGTELDTAPLVERWTAEGRRLYVPRADRRDRMLHVHPWPSPLVELSFGLRQPPRGAPEVPAESIAETLDAAIVLGLGFDRRGYRLGYGSGYFDRFLAAHPLTAVGLAYGFQLFDRLPSEPHDVPMTVIVTDGETVAPR